jgi:poly(hydroxyalkanoate) depolymerase family esterase
MNALADELGFIVLYPEQAASANLARCWNWHRPGNQKRGKGEPAAIADLTLHAIATARANPSRVYIAGISAGGAAAAIIAAAYPDIYVAVGVHSGLARGNITTLASALSAMRDGPEPIGVGKTKRPLPTIVFHGDQDGVVHPSNAGGFLNHLRQSERESLSCRTIHGRSKGGRDFTRTLYVTSPGEILLEDWAIHGSGHAWSGGTRAGSHTDPAGPNASREMMRFFLARRRTPVGKARGRRGKACGCF